jgi:hypothetical protein
LFFFIKKKKKKKASTDPITFIHTHSHTHTGSPATLALRPVFREREDRDAGASLTAVEAAADEARGAHAVRMAEQRRDVTRDELLGEIVSRNLAARAALFAVDGADGVDVPNDDDLSAEDTEERAAWEARELARLKRDIVDREATELAEEAERERRAAMTDEELAQLRESEGVIMHNRRDAASVEAAAAQSLAKRQRGAYFQDESSRAKMPILQREVTLTEEEASGQVRKIMPRAQQARELGKRAYGKKINLKEEDTSARGDDLYKLARRR